MKFSQIVRTTWSNIKGNRMRSILTISGIGVGIATVVFLVSLGYGLQEFSIKSISSISAVTTLDVSQGKTITAKLDIPTVKQIEKIPNVEKVSPVVSLGSKVAYNAKKSDVVATAVNEDYFVYEDLKVIKGSYFTNEDSKTIISTSLVKTFNETNDSILDKDVVFSIFFQKPDKSIYSKDFTFKVSGIVQDDSTSFAYVPLPQMTADLGDGAVYSSLKAKIVSKETMDGARKEIEAMGFTVTSVAETIAQVDSVFRIVQIVLALFGGIALVVAAIGMFNTMTIALLERTRDIGIMKAIGVKNIDVYWMFLSEAMMISGLGGIAGVGLGALSAILINAFVNYLAKSVGAGTITLFMTPLWFAGGIFAFSVIIGVMTGFYPARRASSINPLDALRYE